MENNENLNNQVNESRNIQEEKNNNKTIGFVILIIGLALIGIAVYMLFINETDTSKPKENSNTQEKNNVSSDEIVYKTTDGNFTLKLVQRNDPKAIEEAKKLEDDFINEAKFYAYFNDTFLVVTDIYNEDKHYATFGFSGYENAEASGYSLIVNKDTDTLEINPTDLANKDKSCMKENFCGFPHHMSFIKSDLGYFFIDDNNVLYTTTWNKLGYVYIENDKLKEVDSTGVIAYSDRNAKECSGNDCIWEFLNPTKYDVNGNIVNN